MRLPHSVTLTILMGFAFVLSLPIHAQDRRRPDWRPQGLTHERVKDAVRDIEDLSDDFRKSLRSALRDSSLDGTRREDDLNRQSKRLERAMDKVKKGVERRREFRSIRDDVRDALRAGADINVTMRRRRLDADAEREWIRLRAGLNFLAGLFDLPKMDR